MRLYLHGVDVAKCRSGLSVGHVPVQAKHALCADEQSDALLLATTVARYHMQSDSPRDVCRWADQIVKACAPDVLLCQHLLLKSKALPQLAETPLSSDQHLLMLLQVVLRPSLPLIASP